MRSAEENVRELWIEEFKAIRAYAYRTTEGLLAGHKANPLFPAPDTLEEISADGIAEAYQTTKENPEKIMAWEDRKKRRKVLLGFVRNGCRHAITNYRKSRFPQLESDQTAPTESGDDCAELILSLPGELRETATLLASRTAINNCELAEELGISEATVRRHKKRIGQLLGFDLFCRWIARSVESFA